MRGQMKTICILISVLLSSILAQEFISPTNLHAFVNESDEVVLSWAIDLQDKEFNFASIKQLDGNNNPVMTIVNWDKSYISTAFRRENEMRVNGFANVTLMNLDPNRDIAFLISVDIKNSMSLKDTVFFTYYKKAPVFAKRLPSSIDFFKNDPTNKDLVYSVTSSGNPKPEMYGFLNGADVKKISGISLSCTSSENENNFTTNCQLFVDKFDVGHNGSLKVVTKFGRFVETSPQDEAVMVINIK